VKRIGFFGFVTRMVVGSLILMNGASLLHNDVPAIPAIGFSAAVGAATITLALGGLWRLIEL
jgi:hypothetical protein